MGFFRALARPFTIRLRMLMSAAVDGSRSTAEVARMRAEIGHLTTAMQDAHRALGRIEAQVQSLASVVVGSTSAGDGLAARFEDVVQRGDELQRGIYHLSAGIDGVAQRGDELQRRIDHVSAGIDGVAEAAGGAAVRDDRLQLGIDALRIEQQSLAEAISQRFDENVVARDGRLQLGIDALRFAQQSLTETVARRFDEIATALDGRLQFAIDALRIEQQSLAEAGSRGGDEASAARQDRLQIGIDALRIEQQLLTEILSKRFDEIAVALDGQLQLGIDALRIEQQALTQTGSRRLGEVMTCLEALLARSGQALDLSGLLMSRADLLVQRSTVSLGSEILMRIPDGLLLVPEEDTALVAAVWDSQGRLEPGTLKIILALLDKGDCVIDVGANIGLVTLPSARAVGPTGHVIAVEPATRIAALLDRSMALNHGCGRVTLHRSAAGEGSGTAVLHLGTPAGHSSLLSLPGSVRSEQVDVVPLDSLVEPSRRIRLVKIDVEGFELAVWRGMGRILADNPDVAVVVEFGPEHLRRAGVTVDAWLDAFLEPGFTAYEIDEASGTLKPLRARGDLDRVVSLNLLLLRQPPSAYPTLEFA